MIIQLKDLVIVNGELNQKTWTEGEGKEIITPLGKKGMDELVHGLGRIFAQWAIEFMSRMKGEEP